MVCDIILSKLPQGDLFTLDKTSAFLSIVVDGYFQYFVRITVCIVSVPGSVHFIIYLWINRSENMSYSNRIVGSSKEKTFPK